MSQTDDNLTSWQDDLSELIQKKKDENKSLKKLEKSLQKSGKVLGEGEGDLSEETEPLKQKANQE